MARRKTQYDMFRESYGIELRAQVKEILDEHGALTVQAVATRMDVSYSTAQKRLFELVAKGKVIARSIDRKTKIYFLNPDYEPQSEVKE